MSGTQILKRDVPLYIDVTCYGCKRCVALSNTNVVDGRYYCGRCMERKERMKPYDDPECKCHALEDEICEKYPNASWNCDEACHEWCLRFDELVDNEIEFEPLTDECYGCTCPTCGRMVCSWCAG